MHADLECKTTGQPCVPSPEGDRHMSSLLGLADYGSEEDSPAGRGVPSSDATNDQQQQPPQGIAISVVEYHADAPSAEEDARSQRAVEQIGLSEGGSAAESSTAAVGSQFTVTVERKPMPSGADATIGGLSSSSGAAAVTNAFVTPDSPPGDVQPKLAEKYRKQVAAMREGHSVNYFIRHQKRFRNPCLLEQLVNFLKVQECGSNYPTHLYDPNAFGEHEYYDKLEEARKAWEARQARKPGERVEFRSGGTQLPPTASGPSAAPPQPPAPMPPSSATSGTAAAAGSGPAADPPPKRKSKWGVGGSDPKVPRA